MLRLCAGLALAAMLLSSLAMGHEARSMELDNSPITPVPDPAPADPRKIALGQRLFRDPILSIEHTMSCQTCHVLEDNGALPPGASITTQGDWSSFDTPTVFNAALNPRLNWRGEYDTLSAQIIAILANPHVMGADPDELLHRLQGHSFYGPAFEEIYGRPVTLDDLADALSVFEQQLVTPDAPFDRYLKGDEAAIPPAAIEGYRLFQRYGCIACHQGRNVGGNLYQKFGIFGEPYSGPEHGPSDLGRYEITHREADREVFRVPSLRNVANTPPYFHDGSAATLNDAIAMMGHVQLGRDLKSEDIEFIAAFLRTLSARPKPIGADGSHGGNAP